MLIFFITLDFFPPGIITNENLFEKFSSNFSNKNLLKDLMLNKDYIIISEKIWSFFHSNYGGWPCIYNPSNILNKNNCKIDIYNSIIISNNNQENLESTEKNLNKNSQHINFKHKSFRDIDNFSDIDDNKYLLDPDSIKPKNNIREIKINQNNLNSNDIFFQKEEKENDIIFPLSKHDKKNKSKNINENFNKNEKKNETQKIFFGEIIDTFKEREQKQNFLAAKNFNKKESIQDIDEYFDRLDRNILITNNIDYINIDEVIRNNKEINLIETNPIKINESSVNFNLLNRSEENYNEEESVGNKSQLNEDDINSGMGSMDMNDSLSNKLFDLRKIKELYQQKIDKLLK